MRTVAEHPLAADRADPVADRGQPGVNRQETFFAHFRLAPAAAHPQNRVDGPVMARGASSPPRFDPASSFYAAAGKKFRIDALAPLPTGPSLNA